MKVNNDKSDLVAYSPYARVLEVLYDGEMTLYDIQDEIRHRGLKINNHTVRSCVEDLCRIGFIKESRMGKFWAYYAVNGLFDVINR